MLWVAVFGGIALTGLVMVASCTVWLAHKVGDLSSELGQLAGHADQMAALVGQIRLPEGFTDPDNPHTAPSSQTT